MLHPGFDPLVISVKAVGLAYTKGLRNPSGLFPAAMSSSLMSDIILAKMGEAQEVPEAPSADPLKMTSTFSAMAATSGTPRPELLYKPE